MQETENNSNSWTQLCKEKPPAGRCLIVTVINHGYEGCCKRELRYPVYYMEDPQEKGRYRFYLGGFDNVLLPSYSEVIAWMPMVTQYSGEYRKETTV